MITRKRAKATFTAVWDGDKSVTAPCIVDLETLEIVEISMPGLPNERQFEKLEREYITIDSVNYPAIRRKTEDNYFWQI